MASREGETKLSGPVAIGLNFPRASASGNLEEIKQRQKIVDNSAPVGAEIAGLVKQLAEKWGVSAAAPVAWLSAQPRGVQLAEQQLRSGRENHVRT